MLGQMSHQPLLISYQLRFADRFHHNVEIVTRTVEGPIHRSSWGEIARRSRKLANALVAMGIKPGDRVATLAWNTHRHLELYFAVSGIGAVLHTGRNPSHASSPPQPADSALRGRLPCGQTLSSGIDYSL